MDPSNTSESNEVAKRADSGTQTAGADSEQGSANAVSRRRFVIAGSSLAVLASMPGRQVMGQAPGGLNCTPSGFASINLNLSDRPTAPRGGGSPAYWYNVISNENPLVTGTQTFNSVFTNVPGGTYANDATLADIILEQNADDVTEFAAAYLSAASSMVSITPSEIVALYTAYANNLGYDTGSGLILGFSQIIPFLQGLYAGAI